MSGSPRWAGRFAIIKVSLPKKGRKKMDYAQVSAAFAAAADAKRAQGMAHYMRDQFAFFGLSAARRRELARPWLRAAKHAEQVDWSFIDQCWAAPPTRTAILGL